MKKFLLLTAGMALSMSAMAQTTFNSVADTWVRENNTSWKGGSNKTIELGGGKVVKDADDNVIKEDGLFVGLIGFEFSVPAGMKVQSATVKLVTERYKGNPVSVYGYGNDFTEGDACWAVEADYIESALAGTPAATFTPAGQKGKAIFDDGISEERQTLEAWTNTIDITSYVKSLSPNTRRINLLLTEDGDQVCFYTRETEDVDAFALDKEKTSYATQFKASEVLPKLIVTYAEDADTSSDAILPIADTFVRSNLANQRFGDKDEMEIYQYTNNKEDGTSELVTFVGLLDFVLPSEINSDNYELSSVELRLVTTMLQGNRTVDVYKYDYPLTEDDKWEAIGTNVESTLSNEPIHTFDVKGQGNKSLKADELNDDYKTAEAWTNYIDLTEYVKENLPMDRLTLLLNKPETSNRAVKFASKEIQDVTNAKDATVTFAANDLKPQLVVTYSKVSKGDGEGDGGDGEGDGGNGEGDGGNGEGDGGNGEDEGGNGDDVDAAVTVIIDLSAPAEYFNLQGARVANPDKGIYIVRQGNNVSKMVIK